MNSFITLTWSDFKSYLNSNFIAFKMVNQANAYYLYMADGALTAMTVILKDGGSDQTDFEANYKSQANRAINYYSVALGFRQSAATAANSTVFSLRNPTGSTKTLFIELINLNMSFDSGTPLGRSTQTYNILGFNTATPTGGTAINIAPLDSNNPTSQVTDVRFLDTGLTTTGVVFGNKVMTISCPATDQTVINYKRENPIIKLMAGEGLAIRLGVAAVIGQSLAGEISWSER